MAIFSVQDWRDRAERRFNKKNTATTTKLFRDELRYIRDIEVVLSWCNDKKIVVEFQRKISTYNPEDKTIVVAANLKTKTKLHVLLHECGHHLIGAKGEHERLGRGYSDTRTRSVHHKLDVLEEEFEAWHRGFKLAARLGLKVDKESYDRTRIDNLKTYVAWAYRSMQKRKKKKSVDALVGRSTTHTIEGVDQLQNGAADDRLSRRSAPRRRRTSHLTRSRSRRL